MIKSKEVVFVKPFWKLHFFSFMSFQMITRDDRKNIQPAEERRAKVLPQDVAIKRKFLIRRKSKRSISHQSCYHNAVTDESLCGLQWPLAIGRRSRRLSRVLVNTEKTRPQDSKKMRQRFSFIHKLLLKIFFVWSRQEKRTFVDEK